MIQRAVFQTPDSSKDQTDGVLTSQGQPQSLAQEIPSAQVHPPLDAALSPSPLLLISFVRVERGTGVQTRGALLLSHTQVLFGFYFGRQGGFKLDPPVSAS